MPVITAHKIHDGHNWLPAGTAIRITDEGTITDTLPQSPADTVHYDGVLAPGFVNTHCHLELSHMKGVVPERTGLIPFLKSIPATRNRFTDEEKKAARNAAFENMLRNGVVAVGDIANTTDSTDLRESDRMHFCTFVEAIGFLENSADRSFGYAQQTLRTFDSQTSGSKTLKQFIVPHAPYSVSANLFRMIGNHNQEAILSIHNQESEEENKFFRDKTGDIRDLLQSLSIDYTPFLPSGKSSLQSYLPLLGNQRHIIFVHNTASEREDVQYAKAQTTNSYWCLCPNANRYIENRLPDIDMLMSEDVNICIGTDSLASNHELSVLSELATIKEHYPHISWETLLRWGTANGAEALQMSDQVGTIEHGKCPGILRLKGIEEGETPKVQRLY